MNIEELKKIVRGNGFQESHGSTTIVIDVETVIDLLDELKQCDIPVVVGQSEQLKSFLEWYNDDPFGEIGAMSYDKAIKEYLKTI